MTLFVNKADLRGDTHPQLTWGPAQAGVAAGVTQAVADGLIPAEAVDDVLAIVAVWVDWSADDAGTVFAEQQGRHPRGDRGGGAPGAEDRGRRGRGWAIRGTPRTTSTGTSRRRIRDRAATSPPPPCRSPGSEPRTPCTRSTATRSSRPPGWTSRERQLAVGRGAAGRRVHRARADGAADGGERAPRGLRARRVRRPRRGPRAARRGRRPGRRERARTGGDGRRPDHDAARRRRRSRP